MEVTTGDYLLKCDVV